MAIHGGGMPIADNQEAISCNAKPNENARSAQRDSSSFLSIRISSAMTISRECFTKDARATSKGAEVHKRLIEKNANIASVGAMKAIDCNR